MKIKTALVTGANGYLASHIIKILLENNFKVIGTVGEISKIDKYKHLFLLNPEKNTNLIIREGDLTHENMWMDLCKNVDYVLHIASPIPPNIPKDEDEIIVPALKGTENVMKAAIFNKVKKIVLTSGCLTMWFGNEDKLLNESFWGDVNKCSHYPKSKLLSELKAWELYNKSDKQTALTVILPSLIMGPFFVKHSNSSVKLMEEILFEKLPGIPIPDCEYSIVDVRDVATAHYRCLYNQLTDGQRYIVSNQSLTLSKWIEILKKKYSLAYSFKNKEDMIKEGSPIVQRSVVMMMGKALKVDNRKSIEDLNITYINIEKTILEMAVLLKI